MPLKKLHTFASNFASETKTLRAFVIKVKGFPPWLAASVIVYLVCMPLDSFCVHGICGGNSSWGDLILGWAGILVFIPAAYAWLANPLLFASWALILMGRQKNAMVFSSAAFAFGFLFLIVSMLGGWISPETGKTEPVTDYAIGYWLWLVSMVCAVISSVKVRKKN